MNRKRVLALLMAATLMVALAACEDKAGPSKSLGVHILRIGSVASQPGPAAAPTKDVICQLSSDQGIRSSACSFILRATQAAYGPYLVLAPGRYFVDFETSTNAQCAGGDVTFDVATAANGFVPLARRTIIVKAPVTITRLSIGVDEALGDSAPLEFRTIMGFPSANCLRLDHVLVRPG